MTAARLTRVLAARLRDERGAAVLWGILLTIVLTGAVAAVVASSLIAIEDTRDQTRRAVGLPPADGAITRYLYALRTEQAGEVTNYVLTRDTLEGLVESSGGQVVSNSSADLPEDNRETYGVYRRGERVATMSEHGASFSVRERYAEGWGYWQIVRIDLPDFAAHGSEANLGVYFRAWMANEESQATSDSRTIRVEFRPGRFADYQILSDGPIAFSADAAIDGPVHSNGFADDILHPPPKDRPDLRIWAHGTVNCAESAMITTAQGDIDMDGCNQVERTGEYISFLRAANSFESITNACAHSNNATCFPALAGSDTYRVKLDGSQYRLTPIDEEGTPVGGTQTHPIGPFSAAIFEDDVRLSGFSTGRLTVAARRPPHAAGGAASITIEGDLGNKETVAGEPDPKDTLGVLAQGDVIVELEEPPGLDEACPVSYIRAAVVAASGSLTIPPEWATAAKPGDGTPFCNTRLTIVGAVAVHRSPTMFWSWGANGAVGFASRDYQWDEHFRNNPPPYFPLSDVWETAGWREANQDCLTGGRVNDPRCR